ncbi:MAG: class I tRNA ligase family protein, partial [Clostridia bacterium]|nr:class I tRNA ligase family protein [Clostridia bacterium]
DVMISGYVTSADVSKLSKKSGNNKNSPQDILATYSADVTRYWANNLSLGKDTCFSFESFDAGKKLANKLWNASKFVLSFLYDYTPKAVQLLPMDKYILEKYKKVYASYMKNLDRYDISLSLNEVERFFWNFCDDYIEVVKRRLYNPDVYGKQAQESAQYACYHVLLGMLKMFSNFMPHLTEEIYMDYYAQKEGKKSLHVSGYLNLGEVEDEQLIKNGDEVMNIVSAVRQFKSENKISLKTFIQDITISSKNVEFVKSCEVDIKAVCSINEIKYADGEFAIEFGEIVPDEE